MRFTTPNKLIDIKKMQCMSKEGLVKEIKRVNPNEKIEPWNYTHTVLMDILNYNLNREEERCKITQVMVGKVKTTIGILA